MPPRDDRHREIEADDGVHRDHERGGETCEEQVGDLVALPVAGRAAPSHGEHAVDHAADAVPRSVAERRQVRDQADVPEEQRDGEVGRDREHVPHQRAPELRPQGHDVGVGNQPVEVEGATEVEEREEPRAGDREEGHRLGEAVDRLSPLLAQEEQDRRDERARMADPDPPHEVDDGEPPPDGDVDAPDADARDQEVGDRVEEHHHDGEGGGEAEEPTARGPAGQDDRADLVGDRGEGVTRLDDRGGAGRRAARCLRDVGMHVRRAPGWGCGPPRGTSSWGGC